MRNFLLHIMTFFLGLAIHSGHAHANKLLHKAAFIEEWSRYPTPHSILEKFRQDFPNVKPNYVTEQCRQLNEENRPLLGDSEPATGKPTIDRPNSSFVNWYFNCLSEFIKNDNSTGLYKYISETDANGETTSKTTNPPDKDVVRAFSQDVVNECYFKSDSYQFYKDNPDSIPMYGVVRSCRWSKLSTSAKDAFIEGLIEWFIGPEDVVIDLGVAKSNQEFIDILRAEVDTFSSSPDSKFDFLEIHPDEKDILTIHDARSILQLLINVKDTLKY